MKIFTKLRKFSSGNLLSTSKNNENIENAPIPDSLDYFRDQSALGRSIVDGQRQMMRRMGERTESVDSLEFEAQLNDEFINDRARIKYGIRDDDFSLEHSEWFPRLRYHHKHTKDEIDGDGDSQSLDSYDSDYSHDGFAGPFSWESKSLQELEFPSTPEDERKLFTTSGKAKKKMSSTDLEEDSHRTFETIDEIRQRLKKNYVEAKRQREKYLNLSPNKQKIKDTSLNGYRSKFQQQPVFKNYKQKPEILPKTNGVVKFSEGPEHPETFAAELTNALRKSSDKSLPNSVQNGNISNSNTPRSPSGYSLKSELKSSSGVSTGSIDNSPSLSGIVSSGSIGSSEAPRTSHKSSKDDVNSSRKNSFKKNIMKRSDSGRKSSPEITKSDIESVVANQNAAVVPNKNTRVVANKKAAVVANQNAAVVANQNTGDFQSDVTVEANVTNDDVTNGDGITFEASQEVDDTALSNVMDMLANW